MDSGPVAAVCCQGAGVLSLIDLTTGDRLGTVEVGEHPVHATVVEGRVYVATMGARSVAVIDGDGSVEPLHLGVLGPSHFVTARSKLFVSCTAGDVVAAIDPVDVTVLARIGVGSGPHELATDDRFVYVGTRGSGTVDVIDAEALELVDRVRFGNGARVEGIAVGRDDRLFAIDAGTERLVGLRGVPGAAEMASAPIGSDPYELAVGDRVIVPERGDGSVATFSQELALVARNEGFQTPVDVVSVGDADWIVDRGDARLQRLDAAASIPTPAGAIRGCKTKRGILLSHYDDAAVSLVSPDAGVCWRTDTPANPFGAVVV